MVDRKDRAPSVKGRDGGYGNLVGVKVDGGETEEVLEQEKNSFIVRKVL